MFEKPDNPFLKDSRSPSELDKVAQASKAISKVRDSFQQELDNLTDQEVNPEILERASRGMIEAVEQQGLDLETFTQFMEAVLNDEELKSDFPDWLEDE